MSSQGSQGSNYSDNTSNTPFDKVKGNSSSQLSDQSPSGVGSLFGTDVSDLSDWGSGGYQHLAHRKPKAISSIQSGMAIPAIPVQAQLNGVCFLLTDRNGKIIDPSFSKFDKVKILFEKDIANLTELIDIDLLTLGKKLSLRNIRLEYQQTQVFYEGGDEEEEGY